MRVKVEYSEDVSDDFRRAINLYHGKPGLATRDEVKQWLWLFGHSMDDDIAMLTEDGE